MTNYNPPRMSDVATVLYPAAEIGRRVGELGSAISSDYRTRTPVLISVLKGGFVFLADLLRQIRGPVAVEFMSISSYAGQGESLGRVRILKDLDRDIGGQDVLIVEDIVDTGLTLSYLISVLQARGPSSVSVCTLLDKSVRRIAPLEIAYAGFVCPDRFVVGYGLDYLERYRNLPDILAIEDMAALTADPDLLMPLLRVPGAAEEP